MRTIILTSVLAAAALGVGAGTAAAQTEEPADQPIPPSCILIDLGNGQQRCLNAVPTITDVAGSVGYGSFGTGSLTGLVEQIVLTGSNALSLQIPIATGSYAPGSLGSYGPEASVGELSTTAIGSVIQGSLGS